MAVRTITVHTDSEGAFTYERVLRAVIHGIEVQLGTGDAPLVAPDIDITDDTYGTSFLSEDAIATDSAYFPGTVCMGTFKVAVAAGASQRGRIVVLYG